MRILKTPTKIILGISFPILLVAPLFGIYTQYSLELGKNLERFEQYEGAWLCGLQLYISYRAMTIPTTPLSYRLGAKAAQNQPRYMEINLEHMPWSKLTVISGSPSSVMPVFRADALPMNLRCDQPLRIESSWRGGLSEAMLPVIAQHKLLVFRAYNSVAIGRTGASGPEWAGVSVPYERSVREWWSYPICAIAFVPALALDVLFYPIFVLLSFQH
jgi:hypothetical protein